MLTTLQRTLGRVLVLAGALVLGFWGQLTLKQFWLQRSALHALQRDMAEKMNRQNVRFASSKRQRSDEIVGQLEIPRIHISVVVLEGSNRRILDIGAGHVEGTALPGTVGNIAIAAHRDTFFRSLREIRTNDVIYLKTPNANYQYEVDGTEIVDPSDVEILRGTTETRLTLITCYPFYYIGPAPKRFIVHARQRS